MYLDSHVHLNDPELLDHVDQVIKEAEEAGVTLFLVPGYDLESSIAAVKLANKYPNVYAAVGYQPENTKGVDISVLKQIEDLAQDPKVLAIGEIGLDYHFENDEETKKHQMEFFLAQIEMANRLDLPVSIHARDALGDMLMVLKSHPINRHGVLHCYSGSKEMVPEFAKLGYYFGFDGPITFKNAQTPKESMKAVPLNRLLSETDSPYLTPVPFRGQINGPKNIPFIVKEMAFLKENEVGKVVSQIETNFRTLFRVKQ